MAVRSLIEAHREQDRQDDIRLLVATRLGVNGTKEAIEDFLRDDGRPRLTKEQALAIARQQQAEDDTRINPEAEG